MTAAERRPAPPSGPRQGDHFVHFHDVSWAQYENVLAMRADRSAPRVAYVDGTLEIMSPSREHESVKSNIGCLVEVWMDEQGLDYRKLGSWTLKADGKGAEPDESYALTELDDPARPDLVVEVVWTHGGIDKLSVYAELAVPEVWRWEAGTIAILRLRDGSYEQAAASEVLAGIDLALLASFLDRTSTSAAKRAYRAALLSG
jgi:Uma2 family endonuclease